MRKVLMHAFAPVVLAFIVGCQTNPAPPPAAFDEQKLHAIDATIEHAIDDHQLPGAVIWAEHNGVTYLKAYGHRALMPAEEPMTEDTIFDAASLTKVIATTPSIMLLVERGQVDIDAPVCRYLDEFRRYGKESITIRQLMTHTSGLRAGLSPRPAGREEAIQMACQEKPINPPGTKFLYSDINYITLGEVVHRVSGRALHDFARSEVFLPLGMKETRYLPTPDLKPRIAPTERDGTNWLRGIVHDPTARRMEGVAGHAGVFTTAADLARFCRMMLNQGELDGVRLFRPETVRLMTSVQSPPTVQGRRGLGWDIDTGYSKRGDLFPIGSYGHTGFTGTALWIDPFSKTFWVFLSNRVHPDGHGDIRRLERDVSTAVAKAVNDFDFSHVAGALSPSSTNEVTNATPATTAASTNTTPAAATNAAQPALR